MQKIIFNTPILFIIFNRPDTTSLVFAEIKKIKPKKLFIAADGPREWVEGENEKCQAARKILEQIDWACEIKTLLREKNLGCKRAVSSAIDWFFENVEEGIILEDDCLPDQSFFHYCENLLAYYRDNEKIMLISGDNFQFGKNNNGFSYYFSRYAHIWGWATWKRAWKHYDVNLKNLKSFKESGEHKDIFINNTARNFWLNTLQRVCDGKVDTWDYQLQFSLFYFNGYAVLPNVNLVSNLGFGEGATHTKSKENSYANIINSEMSFPLNHPDTINLNFKADKYTFYNLFYCVSFKQKIKKYILKIFPKSLKNIILNFKKYLRAKNNLKNLKNIYIKYKNYTMIPESIFIDNLKICQEFSKINGIVVECGVWRGGMIAAISEILGLNRQYYLFDSFEGLPPAQKIDGESALHYQKNPSSSYFFDNCTAEMHYAEAAMKLGGAKKYKLIKGWFSDTLPNFKPEKNIAVLRLDGDWYDSTMQTLENLYKYVVKGGLILIDDYYAWDGCSRAVHDFLSTNKLPVRIHESANGVCYIIKL